MHVYQSTVIDGIEWREIPDYPGYWVNASGEVQSTNSRLKVRRGFLSPITPTKAGAGYLRFYAKSHGERRNVYVHALVLMAFVGPRPEGAEARHLDGDKTNNTLGNLAWGTKHENAADSVEQGVIVKGSAHRRAILTEEQVREIKAELRNGARTRVLAKRFGVRDSVIAQIKHGYSWKHIE